MLKIGSVIGGKYKVLHQVGRGGVGNVYLVINEAANKQWAVKEIRKEQNEDNKVIVQNLIAETRILKQLSHPNLPSIVDILEDDDTGETLIVMDYIEGIPLSRKLAEEGAQPEKKVVKWALQLCGVLNYLHSQDPPIIYRDTKPSNIMLKPDGDVVLIDFGTARVYREDRTEDTTPLGTKGYAAPEQYKGQGQSDKRTDIYNLGATMYHLVTGHDPHKYPYEMYPIRHWDKSLSGGLEKIIVKCTKANPEDRYQDCAELAYALENYEKYEDDRMHRTGRGWAAFLISAAMSVVFLGASFASGARASKLMNDQYELMLRNAGSAADVAAQEEWYRNAIETAPAKADAYMGILDRIILEDGSMTAEESEKIMDILGMETNGKSNEAHLRSDEKSYSEFAYSMGLAYFYYYEGDGNKPLSAPWFGIAKDSASLSDAKKGRAERFYRIAQYYTSLSAIDKAGDTEFSYADYWNDLFEVTRGDIAREDNIKTALVMYRELVSQVTVNATMFRKAGVTQESLESGLDLVREGTDRILSENPDDYDKKNIERIRVLLTEAEGSVKTAYAYREEPPDAESAAEDIQEGETPEPSGTEEGEVSGNG